MATADAEAFRDLFPRECYERWEIAGSVRRLKNDVADVEHVVMPRFGEIEVTSGLFPQKETVCLLWFHLDSLIQKGDVAKHMYGATGPRWGNLYRGCDFRGFNHEIFTADELNWGAQLTIRTGPSEFSQRMVSYLPRRGYRQHKHRDNRGYVFPLDYANELEAATGPVDIDRSRIVPAPDEETFFGLCGQLWVEPSKRR